MQNARADLNISGDKSLQSTIQTLYKKLTNLCTVREPRVLATGCGPLGNFLIPVIIMYVAS